MATITIAIDPNIDVGPVELTWHGLMTAVGIVAGLWLAQRRARELDLDASRIARAALVMTMAGIIGARGLFLLETDPGALLNAGAWVGNRGFSLYGGMLAGALAGLLALRREPGPLRHLDALAAGFPLGLAVGRIGDLINGEHFGPPTDAPRTSSQPQRHPCQPVGVAEEGVSVSTPAAHNSVSSARPSSKKTNSSAVPKWPSTAPEILVKSGLPCGVGA